MPTTSAHLHVVIIGAGLGGLCLAQGLKKNGISCAVYEKDAAASSRSQGYRIRIDQGGCSALRSCLPASRYALFERTCAVPDDGMNMLDAQLQALPGQWIDNWSDGHESLPDLKADRHTMRRVLLDGLREDVHFSRQFLHYDERDDGKVVAHFVNGVSVVADVLVAADGIHSAVATLRFPQLRPRDTGTVCIYGKTPATAIATQLPPFLRSGTNVVTAPGLAAVIDAMYFDAGAFCAGDTPPDDYLYWALVGERARFGLASASELRHADVAQCIARATVNWAPPLQSLLRQTDPRMRTLVPIRIAPVAEAWQTTRVTALGDAIHAMSPAGGLGANTALSDAAMLTHTLTEAHAELATANMHDGVTAAVALYESLLRARSFAALHASQRSNAQLLGALAADASPA